jgi:hypothetical protein
MYFQPPEALDLSLEVGWPNHCSEHVSNKALPDLEGKLKLHEASAWWQDHGLGGKFVKTIPKYHK